MTKLCIKILWKLTLRFNQRFLNTIKKERHQIGIVLFRFYLIKGCSIIHAPDIS